MQNTLISELRSQDWIKELMKHANVYIVGGCVRDAFRLQPIKDIDIIVEGLPIDDVKELLKTFGRSILAGQSFSVIKFKPRFHEGEDFDIAVPRVDRKIGTGHKGFEVSTKGVTVLEDLKRRDFTINSMAINIKTGELLDPFNGKADLSNKILRATDEHAFVEDPLRIVRAIQFAARFRFSIEDNTLSMMKRNAHLIKEISGERILEEFEKILHKNGSSKIALDLIEQSDLDKALFDKKFNKNGFEHFDDLDPVSFYYVLASLGNVSPGQFYEKRLKGEYHMAKALRTLERYFDKFDESKPDEENKWNVFVMLRTSPMLANCEVLPEVVYKIIDEMKVGKIPMKMGDIPVSGHDIMQEFPISGSEIGDIINFMYKEALMNKFDWKDKLKTMDYLKKQ